MADTSAQVDTAKSETCNAAINQNGEGGAGDSHITNLTHSANITNVNTGVTTELNGSASHRPSGIPGLSKIARPCSGHVKPPVPLTPTKNFTDDSMRHVTDTFGKHTLTDNSILTEDTDSFIIGDRIWVGGTKPGQIAYIGETQFAPGEWAGIVLDQPIGKNDGSVGGTRYFQCEPKRGVFSRLTRLTRAALPGADDASICSSSYTATSTPINNGVRRRVESPISPTGSVKSSVRSPPLLNASNTSLYSTSHIIDFKVGDRVIIKSSQGSKVGTVRYIGTTDFAPGEWCGVELDEPRGKNDGSVEGKRYFECAPQFGLFAPVAKVSKSPLKYKPGNCVIHSGAGGNNLPPSGIKRMGSRESMASMTSSITSAASGARRDVLREKQQHVEQLLKERDLDRLEFSKAATHAEEVAQKLEALKVEYEQYRRETESKLREYVDVLTKLNKDRGIMLSQLDDEKRKTEDLQFKFEEAAITKSDIEVNNKLQTKQIQELEAQLVAERQRLHNLEADSSRLFEAEEALIETREEVDLLKKEVEVLVKKNEELVKEQTLATETIANLKQDLEQVNTELKTVQEDNAKTIEKLQQDLTTASLNNSEACNELIKQLEDYKSKLQEKSDTCQKQTEEITTLRLELEQNKALLKENTDKLLGNAETESKLASTIEKLKQELSSKIFDLENTAEIIKTKENEIEDLKAQLETTKLQNQSTSQEIELKYKNEIEEFKNQINAKNEEYKVLSEKLDETNKTLVQTLEQNDKLTQELEKCKKDFEHINNENKLEYDKDISTKSAEITQMATEIQHKSEEINKGLVIIKQLQDDVASKNTVIDELRIELSSSQKHLENEQALTSKLNEQVQSLQLNTGDLQRKITVAEEQVSELTQHKLRLEGDINALISSSGDYSEKLQQLSADLQTKEHLLSTTKAEYNEKVSHLEHANQETQLQLENIQQEAARIKLTYEEKLKSVSEAEASLRQQFANTNSDLGQVQIKLTELQCFLDEKQQQLKVANDEKLCLESELNNLKNVFNDNNSKIEALTTLLSEKESLLNSSKTESTERLETLQQTNQQLQSEVQRLQQELEETKTSSEEKLKAALESETLLHKSTEDMKNDLEKALLHVTELQKIVSEKEASLKTATEEKLRLSTDLNKVVSLSGDTSAKMQQLTSDLTTQENLLASTKSKLAETLQELQSTKQELSNMQNTKTELDEKLQTTTETQMKLQQQYDTLFSDKQKATLDLTTLQYLISEKDLTIKEKSESEAHLKEQLQKISTELEDTTRTLTQRLDDLKTESSNIKEQLSQKTEIENKLKQEHEITVEKDKASTEEIQRLQLELNTKNQEVEKLKTETEKLKQTNTSVAEKDARITQLITEIQTTQQLVTQLQIDKGTLELEKIDVAKQLALSSDQNSDLLNQVAAFKEKLDLGNKLTEDLIVEKNHYAQIFQQLRLTDKQMQQLIMSLKEEIKQNGEQSLFELAKTIRTDSTDEQAKNILEIQRSLEVTRQELKETKNHLQNQQNEVLRLQDALSKAQQKAETPIKGVQNSSQINNNTTSDDRQQLIEEKQLAEGQIQFLNSIIVDMQKKNEEQRMRIELLESGFSPAAVSELKLFGVSQRNIAPRMYCDICEEFDKHQTEDCPLQSNDCDAPATRTHSKKDVPERPYCEICEVFGHSTEDCKEDETY